MLKLNLCLPFLSEYRLSLYPSSLMEVFAANVLAESPSPLPSTTHAEFVPPVKSGLPIDDFWGNSDPKSIMTRVCE